LEYFEGAWPTHAQAIIHTRQAEPPRAIRSLFMPFQFNKLRCIDSNLLGLSLFTCVDCLVLVLVDFDVGGLRQCFGNDRTSNKLYQKTKSLLHETCLKHQKNSTSDPLFHMVAYFGFVSLIIRRKLPNDWLLGGYVVWVVMQNRFWPVTRLRFVYL
jgi:hypothetical protein